MYIVRLLSHPLTRANAIISGILWSGAVALADNGMFSKIKSSATKTINHAYGGGTAVPEKDLVTVLSEVINISLTFIGIIFFGLLLYGGWLWMTARGDSGQIDRAKQITREVVIGLIIIFLARLISEFVFRTIGGIIDQS